MTFQKIAKYVFKRELALVSTYLIVFASKAIQKCANVCKRAPKSEDDRLELKFHERQFQPTLRYIFNMLGYYQPARGFKHASRLIRDRNNEEAMFPKHKSFLGIIKCFSI